MKRKAKLQPTLAQKPVTTTAFVNDSTLDIDEEIGVVGAEFPSAIGTITVEVSPSGKLYAKGYDRGIDYEFHSIALVTVMPSNGNPIFCRHIFIETTTGDVYLSGNIDPVTGENYPPKK